MNFLSGSTLRWLEPQRGGIFFRVLFLVFFLGLLFIVYLVRYPILRLAGNFWVVDEPPRPADAIIVLGDDNYLGERAARATEIFKAGWAPRIVASGRVLRPYAGVAELIEHDLKDRGVPVTAIVRFNHNTGSTREEAAALSEFVVSHGWKRILVVTSNYHTRRSRYIYERTMPAGTELRLIAAHDSNYDPNGWWRTRDGLKLFFRETLAQIVAVWEMRHKDVETTD
jgi:uncharacterized SAM-binding protein YcdF (DUF218 family)